MFKISDLTINHATDSKCIEEITCIAKIKIFVYKNCIVFIKIVKIRAIWVMQQCRKNITHTHVHRIVSNLSLLNDNHT